jgi:hypothetical protein
VTEVDEFVDLRAEHLLGENLLEQVPHLGRAVAQEMDLEPRPLAQERDTSPAIPSTSPFASPCGIRP